jgi:predicted nuclease of predicted toxin-antitoxin system
LNILLDHNLDRNLKRHIAGHTVETARERGWSDLINGELLTRAESHGFDVLLTADSHIKSQQNLAGRQISVLVLRSFSNRLDAHLTMLPKIHRALSEIQNGQIIEVFHADMAAESD